MKELDDEVVVVKTGLLDLNVRGSVPCGPPEYPWDQTGGKPLRNHISDKPNQLEIVEVLGHSMAGAKLLPGDWLIVDCSREPKAKDIVLCRYDFNKLTVKRFTGSAFVSETRQGAFVEIPPDLEGRILGVVVKVIKNPSDLLK